MMRKKQDLKKDIAKLLIMTTIVVVIWIGFEVYFRLVKPTVSEVSPEILRPFDPVYSKEALGQLDKRRFINEETLKNLPVQIGVKEVVGGTEEATAASSLGTESQEGTGAAELE